MWWGAHTSRGWPVLESLIGRHLAIIHDYLGWTQIFPDPSEKAASADNRIILVDWTATNYATGKAAATWSQIAAGDQNHQIDLEAAALKAFAKPIMVTFVAEPEQTAYTSYGTATQYAAAWRHVFERMAQDGVHNVVWVWDVTGDAADHGSAYPQWYPGDSYVGWIMWDPYNWYTCRGRNEPWRTFLQTVSGMYDWLEANSGKPGNGNYDSKPWGLAEFASAEGPTSTSKQQWLDAVVSTAQTQFPRLKALVYFDAEDSTSGRTCNWRVDSSATSLAGYKTAGLQSYVSALP